MTRFEIQAIQRLPRRYVRDGTQVAIMHMLRGAQSEIAVACNGVAGLPVIGLYRRDKQWHRIRFTQSP